MFVYFPEFIYRFSTNLIKSTFNKNNFISEEQLKDLTLETLNSESNLKIVNAFKSKTTKLPLIEYKHCFQFTGQTSNYDYNENKILICKNLLNFFNGSKSENYEDFKPILSKELEYAYQYNINNNNKDNLNNLNVLARFCLNACKSYVENINYNSIKELKNSKNNLFKSELIKRCAYIDLKQRYGKELEYYFFDSEDNLNEKLKGLIEQNF